LALQINNQTTMNLLTGSATFSRSIIRTLSVGTLFQIVNTSNCTFSEGELSVVRID
jgi:hypothetical protein